MDKKLKHALIVVGFGILLFAALTNLSTVVTFLGKVGKLVLPLIVGFVLAFVLNVPMRGIEKRLKKLFAGKKKAPGKKLLRFISLFLTLIILALVIFLLATLIIPELVESAVSLYDLAVERWPVWMDTLRGYDFLWLNSWLETLDIASILSGIGGAGNILSSAVDIVTTTVSGVITVGIGLVIMIYSLITKDELARQGKKFLRAVASRKIERNVIHVLDLINKTYSRFLSGQCLEACILGSLIFIAFSIAGIPYASITAVLTAVCAFVPYVGAFLACFVGAFLVLLANPGKLILCVVLYIAVQFVENQFIYPHVVGTSVGLGAMWTLMAVILGGKLFGLLGMIFFIPLVAVLMTLVKEWANARVAAKEEANQAQAPPEAIGE